MPTEGFFGLRVQFLPAGPWRIGPDSGDRDRVDRIYHSDSLYSAFTHAMAQMGMIEEWLDETARAPEPAVRFSSCFPCLYETLFVVPPRHLWPPPASAKVRWKGARFVPLGVVDGLLSGRPLVEDEWTVDGASECLVPAGSAGPFRVTVRSAAAVDRDGAGVVPHSTACLEFTPGGGLWMFAAFSDDASRERWSGRLHAALRLLADSGFGGKRSRGWGRSGSFKVTEGRLPGLVLKPAGRPKSAESPNPGDGAGETAYWMLSLFQPGESDAIDWQRGSYSLTTRGGRIESEARWGDAKKPTRMIAEGSVIVSASEPRGSAANVAPEDFPHPVYRAGFALAIPVPLSPAHLPVSAARASIALESTALENLAPPGAINPKDES
jgi:CRISPR type III-A-associated RAMP protein Csm4